MLCLIVRAQRVLCERYVEKKHLVFPFSFESFRKVATEEILVEIGVRCQEVYIVELLQQRYIENLSMLKYFLVLATEAILFEIGGSCRALKRDLARK